ncbi:MAG: Flp pilus assembly complex ATPase component TadA [Fibrobacteres bacterium]|nr:Flp pilus assembly complex ATPase component TadA [Fibrobacterota bacterium]
MQNYPTPNEAQMVLAVPAVKDLNGKPLVYKLKSGIQKIGRSDLCEFIISDTTVSSIHAEIDFQAETVIIRDLGSTNGVYVDGKRVQESVLLPSSLLRIGGVDVKISSGTENFGKKLSTAERQRLNALILAAMNADRVELTNMDRNELDSRIRKEVETLLLKELGADGLVFADSLIADILGLGPLEPLLSDPTVSEIMVNGPDNVFVERSGKLVRAESTFTSDRHVREVIERIVLPLGRRIDDGSPIVDARLKDGSRVNAVIPPLALDGPIITIRKFSNKRLTPDDLIKFGSADRAMLDYLENAVKSRKNIVISGGTGSGKTTLLNIIASFIPDDERVVTIEDAAELSLPGEHVVRLESRPANLEGKGAIAIRDLVRNALRMRPDRIVIGECRGGEALDMLQAMNTGHDGSLTTGHANTPIDMVRRLEVMVLLSGVELPVRAIREQISSAVNVIVQQTRLVDGRRKITSITELCGMDDDAVKLREIFKYDHNLDKFVSLQV